jgi:hypothetical protein
MAKPVHSMIACSMKPGRDFYTRLRAEVADHLKFTDFALIYRVIRPRHSSRTDGELRSQSGLRIGRRLQPPPSWSTISMPACPVQPRKTVTRPLRIQT